MEAPEDRPHNELPQLSLGLNDDEQLSPYAQQLIAIRDAEIARLTRELNEAYEAVDTGNRTMYEHVQEREVTKKIIAAMADDIARLTKQRDEARDFANREHRALGFAMDNIAQLTRRTEELEAGVIAAAEFIAQYREEPWNDPIADALEARLRALSGAAPTEDAEFKAFAEAIGFDPDPPPAPTEGEHRE